MIRVGTAGWTIPRRVGDHFPAEGSGLARYAARFTAAEINSTFYRSHKPETYARWTATVPEHFRFAVKMPKAITHERRLVDCGDVLKSFLDEARLLGPKLGPLLIQFPPSFAFDAKVVAAFLRLLRRRFKGRVACEPRHASWFEPAAERLLVQQRVARVAADPARVAEAAVPGGFAELVYFRLHGSPRMYYSEYGAAYVTSLARQLASYGAAETWCIFDNTVSGAAASDALRLNEMLTAASGR